MSDVRSLIAAARRGGAALSLTDGDRRVRVSGLSIDDPLILPLIGRKSEVIQILAGERGGTGKPPYFKAIATNYRQFEFRSRLEAKWASFFDLCGWSWSYEPPEFAGWIPDFAIGHGPTLVEVKPFYREEEFAESKQKIFRSGCRQNVILLGADPVWMAVELPGDCSGGTVAGWLLEVENDCCWPLHFGITEGNGKPGLCPMDGPWRNPLWLAPSHPAQSKDRNETAKWYRVSMTSQQREKYLVENWATACNISKWVKQ